MIFTDDRDSGKEVIVKDTRRKHCELFNSIFKKYLLPDQNVFYTHFKTFETYSRTETLKIGYLLNAWNYLYDLVLIKGVLIEVKCLYDSVIIIIKKMLIIIQ